MKPCHLSYFTKICMFLRAVSYSRLMSVVMLRNSNICWIFLCFTYNKILKYIQVQIKSYIYMDLKVQEHFKSCKTRVVMSRVCVIFMLCSFACNQDDNAPFSLPLMERSDHQEEEKPKRKENPLTFISM